MFLPSRNCSHPKDRHPLVSGPARGRLLHMPLRNNHRLQSVSTAALVPLACKTYALSKEEGQKSPAFLRSLYEKSLLRKVFDYRSSSLVLQPFVFAATQSVCHYMQMFLKNQGFTHKNHSHTAHRKEFTGFASDTDFLTLSKFWTGRTRQESL